MRRLPATGAGSSSSCARSRGSAMRFDLADDVDVVAGAARAYGCFPHLGVGVSSARAIACSEGYAAFLRILWAASDAAGHHFPGAIAGSSPPPTFTVVVPEARRPALHAFLSGTSRRLLAELDVAVGRRDPFMQPALARDRASAGAFFTHGPAALRGLRRRHGLPAQPVPRATIEALLAREVRDAIGDFTLLELPDPTAGLLGARASKTVSIGAARASTVSGSGGPHDGCMCPVDRSVRCANGSRRHRVSGGKPRRNGTAPTVARLLARRSHTKRRRPGRPAGALATRWQAHLSHRSHQPPHRVEWRWIDGAFLGAEINRSESEFEPGPELSLAAALAAYRARAIETDTAVRSMPLSRTSDPQGWGEGMDLRWVLLHLINETARHAGHADATRELLDGTTGE